LNTSRNPARLAVTTAAALAALVVCIPFATGCASSGPKIADTEVSDTELAIRAAENATATQHAKDLLDRAHVALSTAQNDRARGDNYHARAHLEEARAAAEAAESQARSVQVAEQAAVLQRQLDDLDKRIREFNAQARRQ
jgi:Domain of unknown function (DUF4398)